LFDRLFGVLVLHIKRWSVFLWGLEFRKFREGSNVFRTHLVVFILGRWDETVCVHRRLELLWFSSPAVVVLDVYLAGCCVFPKDGAVPRTAFCLVSATY